MNDKSAPSNSENLGQILEDLMSSGQLQGTGYTPENVDDMLEGLNAVMKHVEFDGAEGAEDTDAMRYREPGEIGLMSQFIFIYPADLAESLDEDIEFLREQWNMGKKSDVVAEAIRIAREVVS